MPRTVKVVHQEMGSRGMKAQLDVWFPQSNCMGPVNLIDVRLNPEQWNKLLDTLVQLDVSAEVGDGPVDRELTVSNGHKEYTFHTADLDSSISESILRDIVKLSEEGPTAKP